MESTCKLVGSILSLNLGVTKMVPNHECSTSGTKDSLSQLKHTFQGRGRMQRGARERERTGYVQLLREVQHIYGETGSSMNFWQGLNGTQASRPSPETILSKKSRGGNLLAVIKKKTKELADNRSKQPKRNI